MGRKKNKGRITVSGNMPLPGRKEPGTVIITQPKRFFLDMSAYMMAVKGAENVDFTQRVKLYDMYADILSDGHLSSVIEKRKAALQCSQIEFRRNGKPDEKINTVLQSPWFFDFIGDVMDANFWGFSLFQFYLDDKGWMNYELIPRKNYDPVRRLLLHRESQITGTSIDEFRDTLFVGKPRSLGKLMDIAPYVIYKRNDMADWAQFCEVFGMPIREYTYDAGDDEARNLTVKDMEEQGGMAAFLHPKESELKLIESAGKNGSSDLYKTLYDTCNDEISKIVLGNTLTTQASERGTQALGTVQEKGEKRINQADRISILNILNYDMTDIFNNFGYNTSGGEFYYVEPKELTATQQMDIITKMKNLDVPVGDDTVYEISGIPKPDNYEQLKREKKAVAMQIQKPSEEPPRITRKEKEEEEKKGWLKNFWDFFVKAPEKGALEW